MHPNPVYRNHPDNLNLNFARSQGFGMLIGYANDELMVSHIPFLVSDDGSAIEFHLVRSNPLARALKDKTPVKLVVQGPHSYVSPDWYGIKDQVPTWNYVAVHITGAAVVCETAGLEDLLDRQSAFFENKLSPKAPWTTHKMTKDVMERMMHQIVPCRMKIASIDGTWKLNQNKPDAARESAAHHIPQAQLGLNTHDISTWMMSPPPQKEGQKS